MSSIKRYFAEGYYNPSAQEEQARLVEHEKGNVCYYTDHLAALQADRKVPEDGGRLYFVATMSEAMKRAGFIPEQVDKLCAMACASVTAAIAQAGGSGDGVREALAFATKEHTHMHNYDGGGTFCCFCRRLLGRYINLDPKNDHAGHAENCPMFVARAALSSPPTAEVRGGWRSMDSAPKDGTRVLLLGPDWPHVGVGYVEKILGPHFIWERNEKLAFPGGWQPLPAAPSAERTGE